MINRKIDYAGVIANIKLLDMVTAQPQGLFLYCGLRPPEKKRSTSFENAKRFQNSYSSPLFQAAVELLRVMKLDVFIC
jgi:hypothetical protein